MQHLKNKQSYSERPLRWNVSLEIIFHLTLTYDEKNLSDFKSSTNLSNFHLKIFVCDTMKLQRCSETRIFWINHFLKSLTTVIYCKAFLLYRSKHTTSCVYWSVSGVLERDWWYFCLARRSYCNCKLFPGKFQNIYFI